MKKMYFKIKIIEQVEMDLCYDHYSPKYISE